MCDLCNSSITFRRAGVGTIILDPSNIAISDPSNEVIDIYSEINLYLLAKWLGGKLAKFLPDRRAASNARYSSSLLRPISFRLSEDLACRQWTAVSACIANSSVENTGALDNASAIRWLLPSTHST